MIPPFLRPPIVYVASHRFNNQTPDSGRKREAVEEEKIMFRQIDSQMHAPF